MPATSLKAAEKQAILKKLVTEMKRRYGGSLPKQQLTTFETMMFAAILEDSSQADAEAAYGRLLESFFDLNEIRVSSVTEIETSLADLSDSDWKAMRVREALQYIFEKHYAFDLEFLRRKTQDVAVKELSKMPYQTPFIRTFVVQHSLGAHVLPIDRTMHDALVWMGLSEPPPANKASDDDRRDQAAAAGEDLKSAVKKSDGALICHLLKCVATDPELRPVFEDGIDADAELDPFEAPKRLAELFKNPKKARKKKAPAKAVSRKKPTKKSTSRSKAPKKSASRTTAKKVTKKRPTKSSSRKRTKSK